MKSRFSRKTNFKSDVYTVVKKIPRRKVTAYGKIAIALGKPLWARQVGWVLHQNRDRVVPCYRVVDRNGRLAENFAFGGWRQQKKRLLAEGVKFKDKRHVDPSSFENLRSGSGRFL